MSAEQPFKTLTDSKGNQYPWYILPFDKKGRIKAPQTRDHILQAISSNEFTDVFVFSHGWNNDWQAATDRYQHFISGFSDLRAQHDLALPDNFRPLLIGIIWPSTWLVLPWEKGPRFAAGGAANPLQQQLASAEDDAVSDIAEALDEQNIERFYALANQTHLAQEEALELAKLLNPLLHPDDEAGEDSIEQPQDLVESWMRSQQLSDTWENTADVDDGLSDEVGTADGTATADPLAAGFLSKLDPRHAIRLASVWRMKDRAGKVGFHGVGPFLQESLGASQKCKVHMIGHSFGAKVVLSASSKNLPRKLHSMLLLQPAVSARCFSADADGNGTVGGYRNVLDKVSQPVVTTFSKHDSPLTKFFHLAVRRKSDIGDTQIAGAPSRYAALGGFGPVQSASEVETVSIKSPNQMYTELTQDNVRVLALNGDEQIDGHGDISNEATWWALYEQVRTNRT